MAAVHDEYEVGLIRTDRGLHIDKANQRCDIRHPDFWGGAKCDGITDDTKAIQAALAFATSRGVPVYFPPGSIRLSEPITDAAGRVILEFAGRQNTILRYDGAADDWIISLTQQRSELRGGFSIAAYDSADDYTFNGIRFTASRCQVRDFPLLDKLKNGIKFTTIYGCEVEIDITLCATIGVDFDAEANSNTVWAQEITGKATLGTTGVRNNGRGNICKGQQLSEWTTAYYGVAYSQGTMLGHFVEANTKAVDLEAGASVFWDCAGGSDRVTVAEGASLVTPYGRQHPAGMLHVPTSMLPTRSLSAFYPMTDTSTTVARDYSGNGRTGTVSGSMTNTTGPYGYAKSVANGSVMLAPVGAITYNGAWSFAMLVRPRSWNGGVSNYVLQVVENANSIAFEIQKDNYNLAVYRSGVSVGNFGDIKRSTDEWTWVCVGYDPAGGGTVYNLNPALLSNNTFQSYALSNPLTATPTSIQLGATSNGTIEIGSVAIWDGRVLSKTEMLHWCAQVVPPAIPAATEVLGGNSTQGATSVADGGTITHGLGATPTLVIATPSTASEFVSVTALGATTFTVAIKKHDNTAGTTQTIYWRAIK